VHLEILRRDLQQHRVVNHQPPTTLATDQVVLQLERAALTSNNVSYALSGDMLDYWGFFPTEEGWGRLPVMGFGTVTASNCAEVPVGGRYFGFFPLGDYHVVQAQASRGGFVDVAPWREKHAMAYRSFDLAEPTPHDDAILVFRGLFLTSYLLSDFLQQSDFFGAKRVVITSASSKTSIALAHCLQRTSSLHVVGLTSARNSAFTQSVGEYDEVVAYDDVSSLPTETPTVVVDMAGNRRVIADLHTHLLGGVVYSSSVGATHWDATGGDVSIPEPHPEFFFAPSQLSKRGKEWGRDVLNQRIAEALQLFIEDSARWLTIHHTRGASAVAVLYGEIVAGQVDPNRGHIVSFDAE